MMPHDQPRKRRLRLNVDALQARVRRDTDPAAIGVYQRHPEDDAVTGDVLCCRALHPAQTNTIYRGRMHGQRFNVGLPEGYIARFVRVLGPGESKLSIRMAFTCPASDCRAVTEYKLRLAPETLDQIIHDQNHQEH